MTDQKQILIVSQNSVKASVFKTFLASQLAKTVVAYAKGLSHINLQQWLLLLFLNLLSFSFIALAYLCCADG